MTLLSDIRNGTVRATERADREFTTMAWLRLLNDEASNFEFDTSWDNPVDREADLLHAVLHARVVA